MIQKTKSAHSQRVGTHEEKIKQKNKRFKKMDDYDRLKIEAKANVILYKLLFIYSSYYIGLSVYLGFRCKVFSVL